MRPRDPEGGRGPSFVLRPALALAALLALAVACSRGSEGPGHGAPRGMVTRFPVRTAPVESRRVEYVVAAVGTVAAFEEIQLTSRVQGVVDQVLFQEGDAVKEGQVLAEIDADRYRLLSDSARAALEKARAALEDAQAGLARREAARAQNPGLITEEELSTWRTRVRSGQAEVQSAEASARLAEVNLRDARVRAPAAGVIQSRIVQTGQGVQSGTVMATLIRRDPLLVRFEVPEPDAQRLSMGQTIRFKVRAEKGRSFQARIHHVAARADPSSRMVACASKVTNPDPVLRPGAFAEVVIPVGVSDAAPVIPESAIRPTERGFLAYVIEDGKARERKVELGMRTEDELVEVRSGLLVGEQLVVRGSAALRDGVEVKVEEEPVKPPAPPKGAKAEVPPVGSGGG